MLDTLRLWCSYPCEVFLWNRNPPPPPAGPAHDAHPRVFSFFFGCFFGVDFRTPLFSTVGKKGGDFWPPREGRSEIGGAQKSRFAKEGVRARRFFFPVRGGKTPKEAKRAKSTFYLDGSIILGGPGGAGIDPRRHPGGAKGRPGGPKTAPGPISESAAPSPFFGKSPKAPGGQKQKKPPHFS